MAELDPCELFEEEVEEEEVDPENESFDLGSLVPGLGTDANALNRPDYAALTQPDPNATQILAVQRNMLESAQAGSLAAVATQISSIVSENLDDVTLTPIHENLMGSGGRSTWVVNNHALLDFGPDSLSNGTRFKSKPKTILAYQGQPVTVPRSPSSVVDPLYQTDTFRFVSDRMWFNSAHLDGPQEFFTQNSAKEAHGKDVGSSDFYFINNYSMGNFAWGLLYLDAGKMARINDPTLATTSVPLERWKNYEEIVNRLTQNNSLDLVPSHEAHEIYANKNANNESNWSWADYFAGHVERRFSSEFISTDAADTNGDVIARFRGAVLVPPTDYRTIHFLPAARESNGANLNPYPVIPFYGPRFENGVETLTTSPRAMIARRRLPTVGNVMFEDYVTSVSDLLSKREADVMDVGNKSYYDLRPVYSYYDCLYEKIFSKHLTELELPSPYVRIPDLGFDTSATRQSGLSSPLPIDFLAAQTARLEMADQFLGTGFLASRRSGILGGFNLNVNSPAAQDDFNDIITAATEGNPEAERALAEHMADAYGFNIGRQEQDIYLSAISQDVLKELYDRRYLSPMFVEMELGSIEKSQLAEALTFNGDNTLVRSLFNNLRAEEVSSPLPASYIDQIVQSGVESSDPDTLQVNYSTSDTLPLQSAKTVDFSTWFGNTFEYFTGQSGGIMSPVETFGNIFRMLLIKIRIARFINSRKRSYKQIMTGTPASSEVLGFTIDKYKLSRRANVEPEYISSFHILSNNDGKIDRFVDTQVKYGSIYEYRINRIVAVVGNEYAYSDIPADDFDSFRSASDFQKAVGIINMPTLKIMSIPSSKKRVAISDNPPIYPNVNIIPFKNVDSKVLFNLSSNTGEFLAPPVILEDDDNLQFYKAALMQGLPSVQGVAAEQIQNFEFPVEADLTSAELLRFRSDDPPRAFEVFRMEEYPASINDFRGKKLRKDYVRSDNFAFVDDVLPNKKYYYIFRTEDIHFNVSNPSHVYEVELITVNEAVRLSVKIVEPMNLKKMKEAKLNSSRSFRQFLSIRPAIQQRLLNVPPSGKFMDLPSNNTSEMFGLPEIDKVWDKKFKLRIKSKNTGKEIDINIRFNTKLIKNEENKKVNLIC